MRIDKKRYVWSQNREYLSFLWFGVLITVEYYGMLAFIPLRSPGLCLLPNLLDCMKWPISSRLCSEKCFCVSKVRKMFLAFQVEAMGGTTGDFYPEFRRLCYTAFLHLRRYRYTSSLEESILPPFKSHHDISSFSSVYFLLSSCYF